MSRFGINTGTVANDGTGSTLREAGVGINANFQEIYNCLGDGTDISLDTSTFALKTELSNYLTSADLTGYAQTSQLFDGDYNSLTNTPINTTIQITDTEVSNWNTAYGWGDHAQAGYLSSYTETDTLATVTSRGAVASAKIEADHGISLPEGSNVDIGSDFTMGVVPIYDASRLANVQTANIKYTGSGGILFETDDIVFKSLANNRTFAKFDDTWGHADLYYNGYHKFRTTSDGIKVYGDVEAEGKVYFSNVFTDIASLPDASTYHGMFAHVHGTGKGYFAHGGNWTELLDENTSIPTLLARQSKSIQTTSTIVDGETNDTEEIAVGKTYILYKIETSAAAWVRLYVDTASRTSDSTRDENTDPQPGSGVIAEVITTGAQEQKMTPGVFGWCESGSNIPLAITNKSGSDQQITVTLTYLVLEG